MRIPKASEFFISGIEGLLLNKREHDFLHDHALGGIILFKRNIETIEQVVALNQTIIEANRLSPPLISVDQEGGRVARLRGICTDLPPMAKLANAFIKDPHLAYRIGAMQGRELASLGFNLNYSPVCDVMNNHDNEVIGDRAFSNNQETVGHLARFFIRGIQGAGIAACAKHFPGHGATSVDSHLALPVLSTDLDTLWARELVPFRQAIDANVATIMTAHIVTESIDIVPATLSEKTLTGLLRNRLQFNNVIISDDLDMKAVADHYSLKEIIAKSMHASVDLFIIGNDFRKTMEAVGILQDLMDNDDKILAKATLAAKRIDHLRERYVGKPKAPDLSSAVTIIRSQPHLELVNSCS